MKDDHGSYIRNFCSCEKKAYKNSGLYGIRTLALCDIGRDRCKLTSSDWEQVVELVRYKPVKG